MKLRDRIALALLSKDNSLRAKITSSWERNQPIYPEINFDTLVRQGYRRNELIYACLNKTAAASASIALLVKGKDGSPLPDHPIKRLIQRPNPFMNEYDLWASIIVTQKIAGVAYFEKEVSRGGDVVGLWPLRPDWVRPVLRSRIEISHYEYIVPGRAPVQIEADKVLAFRLWDPLGLFVLWSPVATAMRVGSVDNAATDYVKMFFEKGTSPLGILKVKQRLDDTRTKEIRARWRERYGGIEGWLDPAVLDVDAEYQRIGSSMNELGMDVLDARTESRICAVLGVPPIIVGANVGLQRSTFSNYAEARESWWQDTLIPSFENLLDTLQNQLPPEMLEGVTLEWDYSKVPALVELNLRRSEQYLKAAQSGLITRNEYREAINLETRDDSDVFVIRTASGLAPSVDPVEIRSAAPSSNGSGHKNGTKPLAVAEAPQNGHQHDPLEGKATKPDQRPPGSITRAVLMDRMYQAVTESLERQLPKAVDAVAEEVAGRARS